MAGRWRGCAVLMIATLFFNVASAGEQLAQRDLKLSPGLMALLHEEMRALAGGLRTLATAIPTADWEKVADTGGRMEGSYIMKQRLTPAQKEELGDALPEHFKRLDRRFHEEAGRLAAAAQAGDTDLVVFRFRRLVEACTACHTEYARSRFPGFGEDGPGHPLQSAVKTGGDGQREWIVLESPRPQAPVDSPLEVKGRARGDWYFEGDFPVVLTDWDGRIIAETYATAQGPWMTTDFVPFTATVRFDKPDYGDYGFLILRRANASGLPQHDAALEIRVEF